jgi:hypothetical protein
MWSKITGCSLSHVAYTREEDSNRNWFLEGEIGAIPFVMNVTCATDVSKIWFSSFKISLSMVKKYVSLNFSYYIKTL